MAWIGLVVGAILGAIIWEWNGFIVLGFLGWLAGLILSSKRSKPAPGAAPAVRESMASRLDRLENRVVALEARLAKLEPAEVAIRREEVASEPEAAAASAAEPVVAHETIEAEPASRPGATISPPKPAEPNPIVAWFTTGNAIVRVGVVILFVGLVFLLNYAREHQMLPPELRVGGVAVAAIVLLVLGWRLRHKRAGYALSLQGAGIAVLYLTVFGAMRLYGLIAPGAAFALLAAIAIFSAVMAIVQDAVVLAVIGTGGGFLAPILASTGGGSHEMLFSYYLLLNLGVVAIALVKAWRVLNLVAFAFTFLIGLAWGVQFYRQEEHFASTEPFLIVFFLLYVAVAVLFARSQVEGTRRYVDSTMVFGAPLAAFGLQSGMTRGMEFALAYSALAASALYLVLAWALRRKTEERWHLLGESFLALGVVFATLAIPLALDARWTSAAWALEGAAIIWVGIRQQRRVARAFGLLLQIGAALAYLQAYDRLPAVYPLVDAPFVGAVLLALAGLWTHHLLTRPAHAVTETERRFAPAAFVWGIAWWVFAGIHEIDTFLRPALEVNAQVLFFAATAGVFAGVADRWRWREALWPAWALLPLLVMYTVIAVIDRPRPLAHFGWISWPAAIAIQVALLRRLEREKQGRYFRALHAGTFLVIAALGARELHAHVARFTARGTAWSVASVLVVPAVLLLVAASRWAQPRWPLAPHAQSYRSGAFLPLLVAMGVWSVYANMTHDGRSDPLPYLPLLNGLDLAHILAFICVAAVVLERRRAGLATPANPAWIAIAAFGFLWLNGVLLRTLHHWAGIPYDLDDLMRSVLVQASLSVFWTLIALGLMVFATRSGRRTLWMTGAALMGIVVVKLFLVDLSHIAGIERIVSFIVVGLLMLVIGYFSPVPPRKPEPAP